MEIEFVTDYDNYEDIRKYLRKAGSEYTEAVAHKLLAKIFPPNNMGFIQSIDSPSPKGVQQPDFVVWRNGTLLFFEAKQREAPVHDKIYNVDSLERWIEKTSSEAKKQLLEAKHLVTKAHAILLSLDNISVVIETANINRILTVVVLFHVGELGWSKQMLLRQMKHPDVPILEIRGLFLLVHWLDADTFVKYLVQRSQLYQCNKSVSEYEERLLRYFVAHHYSFEALLDSASPKLLFEKCTETLPKLKCMFDLVASNKNRTLQQLVQHRCL